MKKILLILLLCGFNLIAKAQDVSVEKSTFGIQTGLLGLWLHNEAKISSEIALRTELGFDSGLFDVRVYDVFLMAPVIILEPRWYYNLNKRSLKGKNTAGNSGNFISLKTGFTPDWFVISNYDYVSVPNQLAFIPTWGIRRNIGSHFNYEAGFGLGYKYVFAKGYLNNGSEAAVNLHLRIGYTF